MNLSLAPIRSHMPTLSNLFSLTSLICLLLLPLDLQAQAGYGDNRARADLHPSTMKARRQFNNLMNANFSQWQKQLQLSDVRLRLNQRMMAQYGRGKDSTLKVPSQQLREIMKFINFSRVNSVALLESLRKNRNFSCLSESDLRRLIFELQSVSLIKLDFWGYISRAERLPEFDAKTNSLTVFLKWNEAKSLYVPYSTGFLHNSIARAIVVSGLNLKICSR